MIYLTKHSLKIFYLTKHSLRLRTCIRGGPALILPRAYSSDRIPQIDLTTPPRGPSLIFRWGYAYIPPRLPQIPTEAPGDCGGLRRGQRDRRNMPKQEHDVEHQQPNTRYEPVFLFLTVTPVTWGEEGGEGGGGDTSKSSVNFHC